jgi:pimeloyl-ACP methyl ester carboxylesterase
LGCGRLGTARYGLAVHATGQRYGASTWAIAIAFTGLGVVGAREARADGATLDARDGVRGREIAEVEVDREKKAWNALEAPRATGNVELRWRVHVGQGENAIELPTCAGRGALAVDGRGVPARDAGPTVLALSAGEHVVSARVTVSGYEKRIACGAAARVGAIESVSEGLLRLAFTSPHANAGGGGHAVAFVPPRHDSSKAGAMLVLPHPWNGSVWTYAAYAELLDEAAKRDVVLLFPSGLGNSLYTAPAEDEVMRAIAAMESRVAIDAARVSIAGASMGGAGATTIGFHHPDRFASITSFFGDSKYDLGTYVRPILRDEAGAHAVNALDVVDNVRNVPVWLVHGEDDRVSPIAQSEMLASALAQRRFTVRFDRVPGMGHAGALFAKFARELVARASELRVVEHPARVSYRSVRAGDRCAYGLCLERRHAGDAFFDVDAGDGALFVHATENVAEVGGVRIDPVR